MMKNKGEKAVIVTMCRILLSVCHENTLEPLNLFIIFFLFELIGQKIIDDMEFVRTNPIFGLVYEAYNMYIYVMYSMCVYNVCVIIFFLLLLLFGSVVSILFCLFCLLCMVVWCSFIRYSRIAIVCMLQHIIHVFFHRNKSIIVNINVSTLANMPFSPRLLLVI